VYDVYCNAYDDPSCYFLGDPGAPTLGVKKDVDFEDYLSAGSDALYYFTGVRDWTSGLDIRALMFRYDTERDEFVASFDCWGICGDVDGDFSEVDEYVFDYYYGGKDIGEFGGPEHMAMALDFNFDVPPVLNDIVDGYDLYQDSSYESIPWDLMLGVMGGQPGGYPDLECTSGVSGNDRYTLPDCGGLYAYDDYPGRTLEKRFAYRYPASEALGLGDVPWPVKIINTAPDFSQPDLEFVIANFSLLLAEFGNPNLLGECRDVGFSFVVAARAGTDEADVDVEWVPDASGYYILDIPPTSGGCDTTTSTESTTESTTTYTGTTTGGATPIPTAQPTAQPSVQPTANPTAWPTPEPTEPPTKDCPGGPTACTLSEWSAWSPCSESCYTTDFVYGSRTRTRVVVTEKCPVDDDDDDSDACPPPGTEMQQELVCSAMDISPCEEQLVCRSKCTGCRYSAGKAVGSKSWCQCCANEDVDKTFWKTNPCAASDGCADTSFEFDGCVAAGFCAVDGYGKTVCDEYDLCPRDCEISEWSTWSQCTETCEGGLRERCRQVVRPAVNGGTCSIDYEECQKESCNEHPCPTPQPTARPTVMPTPVPTQNPTTPPPTRAPTLQPTHLPTTFPTANPTPFPPTPNPTPFPTTARACLTGNADDDFGNPGAGGSLPSGEPCFTRTVKLDDQETTEAASWPGFNIERVYFRYVVSNDALHIGIKCAGVCGDANGDGDPDNGADDTPDFSGGEFLALGLDFNLDASFALEVNPSAVPPIDVVLGVPANPGTGFLTQACRTSLSMNDCFGVYEYDDDALVNESSRFRIEKRFNGQAWPTVNQNPSPSLERPDLEFMILRLSLLRASYSSFFLDCREEGWTMDAYLVAGSETLGGAASIDHLPAPKTMARITFPSEPCPTPAPPTPGPTTRPTPQPTNAPTRQPTVQPTLLPTANPSPAPPTPKPTGPPTPKPTPLPTLQPTRNPTNNPTPLPTTNPTPLPTVEPTPQPTPLPTVNPTRHPTAVPTPQPTRDPFDRPTCSATVLYGTCPGETVCTKPGVCSLLLDESVTMNVLVRQNQSTFDWNLFSHLLAYTLQLDVTRMNLVSVVFVVPPVEKRQASVDRWANVTFSVQSAATEDACAYRGPVSNLSDEDRASLAIASTTVVSDCSGFMEPTPSPTTTTSTTTTEVSSATTTSVAPTTTTTVDNNGSSTSSTAADATSAPGTEGNAQGDPKSGGDDETPLGLIIGIVVAVVVVCALGAFFIARQSREDRLRRAAALSRTSGSGTGSVVRTPSTVRPVEVVDEDGFVNETPGGTMVMSSADVSLAGTRDLSPNTRTNTLRAEEVDELSESGRSKPKKTRSGRTGGRGGQAAGAARSRKAAKESSKRYGAVPSARLDGRGDEQDDASGSASDGGYTKFPAGPNAEADLAMESFTPELPPFGGIQDFSEEGQYQQLPLSRIDRSGNHLVDDADDDDPSENFYQIIPVSASTTGKSGFSVAGSEPPSRNVSGARTVATGDVDEWTTVEARQAKESKKSKSGKGKDRDRSRSRDRGKSEKGEKGERERGGEKGDRKDKSSKKDRRDKRDKKSRKDKVKEGEGEEEQKPVKAKRNKSKSNRKAVEEEEV
jgi:hypothetical protein